MNDPRRLTAVAAWLCLALPAGLLFAPAPVRGEEDEPPIRYFLERGDQRVPVLLDQPFELDVEGQKLRYTLRAAPTRILELPALRLEYPRHMPFEYESDADYTSWSLDGNSAVLMIQRLATPAGLDAVFAMFTDSMKGMFGDGVKTEKPASLDLGGRTLKGKRLEVAVSGIEVHVELFPLCLHDGSAYLLMLQDTLDDAGNSTAEMATVRKTLVGSFQFKSPK